MKKIFSIIVLAALFLASCQQKNNIITGVVKDAPNASVGLDQLFFDGNVNPVTSVTADANGKFKIETKEPLAQGLYRIKVGQRMMLVIIDDGDKNIDLETDMTRMSAFDVTVKGSPSSETYINYMKESIKVPKSNDELTKLVTDAKSPILAAMLSFPQFAAPDSTRLALMKDVSKRLEKDMSKTSYVAQYNKVVKQVEQSLKGPEAQAAVTVGQIAPDIELPDPNGKIRKLSDLRGKIVLLDFWASWCGPCRRENPNVVKVYNQYKAKGFDVFSVSLDGMASRDRERNNPADVEKKLAESKKLWVDAIQKDKLPWENHVSDLMQWECAPAQVYGVQSIPNTFLIGKDGKILAINPRNTLEQELEKALK